MLLGEDEPVSDAEDESPEDDDVIELLGLLFRSLALSVTRIPTLFSSTQA